MNLEGVRATGYAFLQTAASVSASVPSAIATSGKWAGKQIVALGSQATTATINAACFGQGQLIRLVNLVQAVIARIGQGIAQSVRIVSPYLSRASACLVHVLKTNAREITLVSATAAATLALVYLANQYSANQAEQA